MSPAFGRDRIVSTISRLNTRSLQYIWSKAPALPAKEIPCPKHLSSRFARMPRELLSTMDGTIGFLQLHTNSTIWKVAIFAHPRPRNVLCNSISRCWITGGRLPPDGNNRPPVRSTRSPPALPPPAPAVQAPVKIAVVSLPTPRRHRKARQWVVPGVGLQVVCGLAIEAGRYECGQLFIDILLHLG
jgi:hypothetical protein